MIVGICKLDLRIDGCHSLKEKRQVLRRLKDRTANQFGIAVAEVGNQDLWQRAELGFAVVGNDRRIIEGIIERATTFIEDQGPVGLIDRYTEIINI
ncbi:MAG: DUF503 domain-containing protein [bacterium]